jgi:hypothetical protein
MDETLRTSLENLRSQDRELQTKTYFDLLAATETPVDWAYEIWDELVDGLHDKDNHVRSISAQILSNLAISDPQGRIFKDFDTLLGVTRDERFVTARHCLQALWKVGLAGKRQTQMVVEGLAGRFRECILEKNCTLIRYDILVGFKNLYDRVGDESIRSTAAALIETEQDLKYRKKYAAVWMEKPRTRSS